MGVGKAVTVAGLVALVATFGGVFAMSATAGCAGSTVDAGSAANAGIVAGYSGDQLTNAAAIINAATTLGLGTQAQTIGVMTAMGESGLRVLDHGDTAGPDSRGLFQQRTSWGSLSDRMDPTKSATFFFQRLVSVSGWESMAPTAAAHAVQINADANYYTKFFPAAAHVVQALTSTAGAGSCGISGNAQALAQELVQAADKGQLTGSIPDHIKEIRWIAQGNAVANCGVDTRILQVMVIAVHTFERIGVSDINRKCTGQIEGAGTESAHYNNGGGHAVDFYSLGGTTTNGADANALRLIGILDPMMPKGAGLGQKGCRTAAGDDPALANFHDFADTCNHLHVDVGSVDRPLKTR